MNHFRQILKLQSVARLYRICGRFRQECRGTSAIEFAFIFPILLIVYFGLIEISNSLEVKRKVENSANLTGMLVAQAEVVNDAYLANVFEASQMAFEPLDVTPLKVVVTSVERVFEDGDWINKVIWSTAYGSGAAPRDIDSELEPPGEILGNNRGIILTEVEYDYSRVLAETIFNDYFPANLTFTRTFWTHPRYVATIPFE